MNAKDTTELFTRKLALWIDNDEGLMQAVDNLGGQPSSNHGKGKKMFNPSNLVGFSLGVAEKLRLGMEDTITADDIDAFLKANKEALREAF